MLATAEKALLEQSEGSRAGDNEAKTCGGCA